MTSSPIIFLARTIVNSIRDRIADRRLTETAGVPKLLMLEASSLCNLKCTKCESRNSSRTKGVMEVDLASYVLESAASMGVGTVCVSMLGEPTTNPNLESIVAVARKLGLFVYFATNGLALTPERSRRLIDAGISEVRVSIDGWDAESYRERMGGANFDLVAENLRAFRELSAKSSSKPKLRSSTTLDVPTAARLAELAKFLEPLADESGLNPLTDFGVPGGEIDRRLLLGTKSWRKRPCPYLWNSLNVGWDGTVIACCNDHNYSLACGNVKTSTLAEIWRSETMRKFRRNHIDGRFGDMPMCGACTRDYANSISFRRIVRKFETLRGR